MKVVDLGITFGFKIEPTFLCILEENARCNRVTHYFQKKLIPLSQHVKVVRHEMTGRIVCFKLRSINYFNYKFSGPHFGPS